MSPGTDPTVRRSAVSKIAIGAGVITLVVVAVIGIVVAVAPRPRPIEDFWSGVLWQADPALATDDLRPVAVIGGAAVLTHRDRILFLDLADGRLRGTLPYRTPGTTLTDAGDRLLIESNGAYQLYDDTLRPLWPKPITALGPTAVAGEVTVLWLDCDPGSCVAGYDLQGREVWRRRLAPSSTFAASAQLPDHVAYQDGHDRWTVLDGADGRRREPVLGDLAFSTGSVVSTLTSVEGRCRLHRQNQPVGRIFSCPDPIPAWWVEEDLLAVQGSENSVTIVRLDGPGGQVVDVPSRLALGRESGVGIGKLGWASLTNRDLRLGDWPAGRSDPSRPALAPLPIDPNDDRPAKVRVDGGTVVVSGTADPRPGADQPELHVIVLDFASGAETGRLRLPGSGWGVAEDSILYTGPGQMVICPDGRPPMLIGRPS